MDARSRMKRNYKLGDIGGFGIYLHWTFILMMAGLFVFYLFTHGSVFAALSALALLTGVFGSVIFHELGHAYMARRYGIATMDITMYPIGGVARLERMPTDPRQELMIALAGPAVNVVIGLLLLLIGPASFDAMSTGFLGRQTGLAANLMLANFFLAAFNMIPAFPMDGGRVLRSILALKMKYRSATLIASLVGQLIAGGFFLLGVLQFNAILMFIGVFVFMGARQESQYVSQTGTG